jgi:transcriptional regulator with PAS, ATPase and Fis domain
MSFRVNVHEIELVYEQMEGDLNLNQQCFNSLLRGESSELKIVFKNAKEFAKIDIPVLIKGEFGTGKSLLASYIHYASNRREQPFLFVDCAAKSDELLDFELFGYQGNTRTGELSKAKCGLLYRANRGTLCLESIDKLSMRLQAKLLHVLEEKINIPSRGDGTASFDVRIITTTNKDLCSEAYDGRFRKNLYYYLSVLEIEIPPLKHRKDEIIPLVYHYLYKFNLKYPNSVTISDECLELFKAYDWPGNMKQLENIIKGLVSIYPGKKIQPENLSRLIHPTK